MGWFFKRGPDVLDLSERYKKQQERLKELKEETKPQSSSDNSDVPFSGGFGIFGMSSSTTTTTDANPNSSSDSINTDGKKIRGYALKNAIAYNGKAQQGSIISALSHEGLKKEDMKTYGKKIAEVIKEVNLD